MAVGRLYTPAEHELAQILVVELLAHQFCSPVQWIKVQDAIFGELATERFIEIGPGNTLTNMAKTTLKSAEMETFDMIHGITRQILCFQKDHSTIYCKSFVDTPSGFAEANKLEVSVPSRQEPLERPTTTIAAPGTVSTSTSFPISDKPCEAIDVVTCLVACALKKVPSEVPHAQTIRALCGGRSTVQNEIIGDLTKEFGALPDQPEDLELYALGQVLADAGKGQQIGACTGALIAKVAATKMPAGVGISAIREYLERRWKCQTGLQNRALLKMVHRQPNSRLAGEEELHVFLDEIVQEMFQAANIDLSPQIVGEGPGGEARKSVVLADEALAAIGNLHMSQNQALFRMYAKRVGHDLHAAAEDKKQGMVRLDTLQGRLNTWAAEHGDTYEAGIAPKFDSKKLRHFDSHWNWIMQDFIEFFNALLAGDAAALKQSRGELQRYRRGWTPALADAIGFARKILTCSTRATLVEQPATLHLLHELEQICEGPLAEHVVKLKHSVQSSMPVLEINEQGVAMVTTVPRPPLPPPPHPPSSPPSAIESSNVPSIALREIDTIHSMDAHAGLVTPPESKPSIDGSNSDYVEDLDAETSNHEPSPRKFVPVVQTKGRHGWRRNGRITDAYVDWFDRASSDGISLAGKRLLVTGAGRNSIGIEIVRFCLAAGAQLLVTTSTYSKDIVDHYQDIYRRYGARGSSVTVVPFNGGSRQDVEKLVEYTYENLEWDLDYIVPFAAIDEAGRALDRIDEKSEIAHRLMLTNTLRLLGGVKAQKALRGIDSHPTYVVLPLSPNHGVFGQDGLYSESKVGLEVLFNKWWSEDWREYLSLCGVIIGWTRGTALMSSNDVVAARVEDVLSITTYSAEEMAWHIMGVLDPEIVANADLEPLKIDLSGGMSSSVDLKSALHRIQGQIRAECDFKRALWKERSHDDATRGRTSSTDELAPASRERKARIRVGGPDLPDYRTHIEPLAQKLKDLVDLERTPVIVGFGEAGPCGSARTRWEVERNGRFSVEGCLELAIIMGLVRYHNGPLRGQEYCGWVDQDTGAPIADTAVRAKYEDFIIQHTGIRRIERQPHDLGKPDEEESLLEVVIEEDLEPIEVSLETAADLQRAHGDKISITALGDGQASVSCTAGTTLYIPKASQFHHGVGSKMPTGWDAKRYGIADDIVAQVDPVTLYALVATAEALLSAGISDPYEFYKYVGVAEIGNAVGSGAGGQESQHAMFKLRYHDRHVQKDIFAETFVNSTAAWINMILLGSSGPIRTPVGACATSLESMDTAFDLIRSGKAKVVLAGGSDTLERDGARGFASMQATIDADRDAATGRGVKEASRPMTSTRAGFVEGEGCAVQIVTTASVALQMGLQIHAIVALSHTASDTVGRSLPAPGKGLLTIAAEKAGTIPSPLLDVTYRRRRLNHRRRQIQEACELELSWVKEQNFTTDQEQTTTQHTYLNAQHSFRDAQYSLGNDFWRDQPSISPLRGALAVWGLTIDDLSFASLHGTSTQQNDANETAVMQKMLQTLGRTKGNVMPCILQKSLLGHGKAAAGGFALNGCMQVLHTSSIPGNRNADNIDAQLADRDLLFFPSQTYCARTPLQAFSVTSFGFGQKGAQVIGVHPRYLFAQLDEEVYENYKKRVVGRMAEADQTLQEGLYGASLVKAKELSVYQQRDLEQTLLTRARC